MQLTHVTGRRNMKESQAERIKKLEDEISLLRKLVLSMCELDNLDSDPIQAWEIRDMLYTWANR